MMALLQINWQPVLELIASFAGFISVYLSVRASHWNWLFGILTVSLYTIIFFHVKLYANMSLQLMFICLQFYGWYLWVYGKTTFVITVIKAKNKNYVAAFFVFLALFFLFVFVLKNYTDSTMIWLDAFITALSLIAQWLMCKKIIENWWFWMVVDLVSIKVYWVKHLYFTSALYAIFFAMCCVGYYHWYKKYSLVQVE